MSSTPTPTPMHSMPTLPRASSFPLLLRRSPCPVPERHEREAPEPCAGAGDSEAWNHVPPLRCPSFSALLSGVERVSFFFFFLDFQCPPTLRLEKKSNESALNISSLSFRSFSRTRPFLALSSAPSSDTGLISTRPSAGKGKEKPAAQGDTTGVFCRRLARFRSVVAGVLSGPSSSPLSLSLTHTHTLERCLPFLQLAAQGDG